VGKFCLNLKFHALETKYLRLWSIHPKYLDASGLVALWREALLAQKVLKGKAKGYKNHPQLIRFQEHCNQLNAINYYLNEVLKEAKRRGYNFDRKKIGQIKRIPKISITKAQLNYEFKWVCKKIKNRCPKILAGLSPVKKVEPHPLFKIVKGDIADWEHVKKC